MIRMRCIVPLVATVLLGFGCSGEGGGAVSTPTLHSNSEPLTVSYVVTPPLNVANYRTRGTFPQVSRAETELTKVNTAIRAAVRSAQAEYAREVRSRWRGAPELFDPSYGDSGIYSTSPSVTLVSASTSVVSALIPTRAVVAGGTGGETWLSFTVRVPSGARVLLSQVFSDPAEGLKVLAAAVRRRVLFADECVRASVDDPIGGELTARGLEATFRNYRHFALTTSGLSVGFPAGQVAASACNRIVVTVPYPIIRPHLNVLGRTLVAGVRWPRTKR